MTLMLDRIVDRVATLPHLPDTVLRLVSVVSNPDSSVEQIVEAIRYDQSLTAEVLRLCNSAYYGLARTIDSLDAAICLLGTSKVFQLVMAAHARTLLGRPQEGYGLPAGMLWLHSAGVATAARLLARRMRLPQMGLLFTAGLLHDVGKIVLNEFVQAQYLEVVRQVTQEGVSFCEAEQRVLGYTHAEAGARLAERWNLPRAMVRCIGYHHTPADLPQADPLVDAVHLADAVCLLLGIGTGHDGLAYRGSATVLRRCGLTELDLESVGAEAVAELRSVQAMFARK